jgi:hypothetical protein
VQGDAGQGSTTWTGELGRRQQDEPRDEGLLGLKDGGHHLIAVILWANQQRSARPGPESGPGSNWAKTASIEFPDDTAVRYNPGVRHGLPASGQLDRR